MEVECFLTSAQLTLSFVKAFVKPARSFSGCLSMGECDESNSQCQASSSVGTTHRQLRLFEGLGEDGQSIGG